MKSAIKSTLAIVATTAAIAGVAAMPTLVSAWGDNYVDPVTGEKGRPSYTIEQINNGAIGATKKSDGENYKNSANYPGQIIFNTISDSVIGSEKNFVGARECVLRADNRCEAADRGAKEWRGNDITVEDGKTYIVRLYVHNNNPNGVDAVAENTKVAFSLLRDLVRNLNLTGLLRRLMLPRRNTGIMSTLTVATALHSIWNTFKDLPCLKTTVSVLAG